MPKPPLHVMFGPSGAGSLRETLAQLGRADRVVSPHDDFSFGPVASGDAARVAWVEAELGFTDWDLVASFSPPFLEASCSPNVMPLAWFSRRDVQSYSGFLWWMSHLGSMPCRVIDVTDLIVRGGPARPDLRMRAVSPSLLSNGDIARLVDTGVDLDPASRGEYWARWRQLMSENAPLRIIDKDGALASAPITHFDPLLLACTTTQWRKAARIVGDALDQLMRDELHQVSELPLVARAHALAESGALEWRGDLSSIRTFDVRLPGSPD